MREEIKRVWKDNHRVFGARKVWLQLRREGIAIGRDRVWRLMREAGLQGARRGKTKFTTRRDEKAARPPDLVEQTRRLLAHGTYERTERARDIRGRLWHETFNLPRLVEVPSDWRGGSQGLKFAETLKEFASRRKQDEPVGQKDLDLLNEMKGLIGRCYEGRVFDKSDAVQSPYARELILLNLALLSDECKETRGKALPGDENIITRQLVRGLFHYSEDAEIEGQFRQRRDPSLVEDSRTPRLIPQPSTLRT